ncbi:5476_t:CDS:2, partial [Cetraspora pellucida]
IQQTKDIERLQDDGYYVNRINEVREEYLNDDRSREQLDRARRSRLDFLYSETENQTYDLLLDLIHNSENINDISIDSELSQDIQTLNQTLLTENRNLVLLENIRKQNYNDGLYDILKTAIEEEKDIEKLKNTWSEVINKLEQEYLTNDRNKSILQQLLNKRIEELQQPIEVPKRPQAKRPIEEVEINHPTTNPDKAEPNRNLAGTVDKQITDIINQYRKTLNAEDQRKYFSRIKIKPVTDIIKNTYNISQDKRSLLDVLYYKWERLKKRENFRKLRKHPMIFVPANISWQNPLGFPEEKIDVIASINLIITEYKKSLANIFEISQKNIDIIQQTLSDMMLNYNTENEKKEFLDVVTEVLINADLEIEHIKHDEIKYMFNSFEK